jgi:hypothetical protein
VELSLTRAPLRRGSDAQPNDGFPPGEAIRGPSRSSTALDPEPMAQTDRQQSLQNLPTRTSSFGQTCLAQTGKEALAIVRAGERPVEALVSYGQGGHAPQQFVERRPARIHPA